MGFDTVVMLLNDQLHSLERDPNAGTKIAKAERNWNWPIRGDGLYRQELDFGYGSVISVSHADDYQVTVVGGNMGWNINNEKYDQYLTASAKYQMAECLERNGFKVTKRRSGIRRPKHQAQIGSGGPIND
jgi:hypothetical protein